MRFEGLLPLQMASLEGIKTKKKTESSLSPDTVLDEQEEISGAKMLQYEVLFHKAYLTFKHQVVYDIKDKCSKHLTPIIGSRLHQPLIPYLRNLMQLPQSQNILAASSVISFCDFSFLGDILDPDLATGIANGLVDPITKMPFDFREDIDISLFRTSFDNEKKSNYASFKTATSNAGKNSKSGISLIT